MSSRSRFAVVSIVWTAVACAGNGPPRPTGEAPFPMPNPPSSGLPHPHSYEPGEELVVDEVTGLAWQRSVDEGSGESGGFTWEDAVTHCDELVLGGHDDFYLPTRVELVTILDPSTAAPAIDKRAFPDTPATAHWTSSAAATSSEEAFSVDFSSGPTSTSSRLEEQSVRCVRNDHRPALPSTSDRFRVDGGSVLDRTTGLRWQRSPTSEPGTRAEARAYCSNLIVNGNTSFRLPSMKELQTIVDETRSDVLIDPVAFPEAPGADYWTSTLAADDPESGWVVRFSNGYAERAKLDSVSLVRCVR